MYKFLPDNEDGELGNGKSEQAYTGNESNEETSQLIQRSEVFDKPVVVSSQKISVLNKKLNIDDDEIDDEIIIPPGPEKHKERKKRKRHPTNVHIRVFNSNKKNDEYEYTVILKSIKKANYDLRFFSIGEDLMDKLNLVNVSLVNGQKNYYLEIIEGIISEKR